MLFGEKNIGAEISISSENSFKRFDALLFGESQGRVVVAVDSLESNGLISNAKSVGVSINPLGKTVYSGKLQVQVNNQEIISSSVEELRSKWENSIPQYMEALNK